MTEIAAQIFTKLTDMRLLRYVLASVGALAVDVGSFPRFPGAWRSGSPPLAAASGYSLGIVAHWLMSSRAVFQDTVAERGVARTRQKAMFVIFSPGWPRDHDSHCGRVLRVCGIRPSPRQRVSQLSIAFTSDMATCAPK